MSEDAPMPDADADADAIEEEHAQYGTSFVEEDLDEKYPNRPHNHSKTLPFRDLITDLFTPLSENRKPTGQAIARRKLGPNHGPSNLSSTERRNQILDRFISKWRKLVGNDIYPAFRLIVPERDRDRAMYGLKEKTIGKLLVKIIGLDKNSDDANNLLNWKLPGVKAASAGDFAGRCQDVIKKRALNTEPGKLTIGEVNEMLDRLSAAQKENDQLPILRQLYNQMNADEMVWLIRMILRQMKIGASEKTIFDRWHADAENLFNVSSSLRRVCWELYDPEIRLQGDDKDVMIMQCFQPQLAAFQMRSMDKIVSRMNLTEDDPVFWIEEKLDGERMQLHMIEDHSIPGGRRFSFWSRKGKDYTYLYGTGFEDQSGALTKHIKNAFNENVRNIILDGEMITWNPKLDKMVAFGHLKTAAISEKQDFADGNRPLFKLFDCLYLNDKVLTRYTLKDRRNALAGAVHDVYRRLEIHPFMEGTTTQHIETELHKVVAESSEGLVVKKPSSMYCLNERNEDWVKVKPEYMSEFGHNLDCVVVGGYYGSGKRGGNLSSFLCSLRLDDEVIARSKCNPLKTMSFFKVGGGFSAADYADLWHRTDGKWKEWKKGDKKPLEYIALGDQFAPDVWIKPDESVVIEVKAAEVIDTTEYATTKSLRFPRFVRLKNDKTWKEALSVQEFLQLDAQAHREKKDKQFKVDNSRKERRGLKSRKKQLTVIGADETIKTPYASSKDKSVENNVFAGLTFYIITAAAKPINKSKAELEQLVKTHGGQITQTHKDPKTICIAEGNQVRVASLKKEGGRNIIRPVWLLDCIRQSEVDAGMSNFPLPYEPRHILFARSEDEHFFKLNLDVHGDSFARDVTVDELEKLFLDMEDVDVDEYYDDDIMSGEDVANIPGWLFHGLRVLAFKDPALSSHALESDMDAAVRLLAICGGSLSTSLDDGPTHVMVQEGYSGLKDLRHKVSKLAVLPRIVTCEWVMDSVKEGTRLDEERFVPV